MKFQSIKKVENNKYLWNVIDVLRNELSIAEDGHVDYVECIDALKEEIKELKRIKAEKQVFLADAYVNKSEVKAENMKLKQEVKELKKENEELKSFHVFANYEMKELKSKIKELKKTINSLNGDVIILSDKNKIKADKINELKLALVDQEDDIKSLNKRIPKEYKKEAEEWFHHNPQTKRLYFFIKDDDDCINEGIERDNAICVIDNDNL